jgi:hypothetical protein
MAEYYNKETLLDFVKKYTPNFGGTTSLQCVERAIENAPTVDVVEVVRCKDCKHYYHGTCTNDFALNLMRENDYCSYGERRSDNG